jgi:hypothetical protein
MRKIVIHNHLPRARDVNAFEHNVSREQEEKNRDKAYRDSGIVRVLADRQTSPPAEKPKPSTPKEEQAAAHKFYDSRDSDSDRVRKIKAEIEKLRVTREHAETAKERDSAHVRITNLVNELKSLGATDIHPPIYRANDKRRRSR